MFPKSDGLIEIRLSEWSLTCYEFCQIREAVAFLALMPRTPIAV